jgi:amino acid adenylation domain-containing protein
MNVEIILNKLRENRIDISLQGENIRVSSNNHDIPPGLLEEIKIHKKTLIEYLKKQDDSISGVDTIPRSPSCTGGYVLSFAQSSLLFLSDNSKGNSAYNIPLVFVIETNVDRRALEYALLMLAERHESLRTVFKQDENGETRQFVQSSPASGFDMAYIDLCSAEDGEQKARLLVQEHMAKPFDLYAGPLLRVAVYQVTNQKSIVSCVMHHIISDGWSMDIFFRELLTLYSSYGTNHPNRLLPLAIQYRDYAIWQRRQLEERQHVLRNYWLRHLEGQLPVLELPADKPRPVIKTFNGSAIQKSVGVKTNAAIRALVNQQGCTLFMGLLAGVYVLLHRYTQQDDIIVGSPVSGRDHADLENQIGFYTNTLALRLQFDEQDSFLTLLNKVKLVTLGAMEHQLYPFTELVRTLNPYRDTSRNPLFDVEVYLTTTDNNIFNIRQLSGSAAISPYHDSVNLFSKFDLSFNFITVQDDLLLNIEYNTDIYEERTITGMLNHFIQLLESIIAEPSRRINELDYLGIHEKATLLTSFNEGPVRRPGGATVIDLFRKQAAGTPGRIAVGHEQQVLSYNELEVKAGQLAHFLVNKWLLKSEDRVGALQSRGNDLLVSMMGIWMAGGAYVPMDGNYPLKRLLYIVNDARIEILLVQKNFIETGYELQKHCKHIKHVICIDEEDIGTETAMAPNVNVNAGQLAYVLYTSGSTGEPKGAMITHAGMLNHLYAKINDFGITENDVIAQTATQTFDVSIWQFTTALLTGGKTMVLTGEEAWSPQRLLQNIIDRQITIVESVPAHFSIILEFLSKQLVSPPLPALRYLIMNGEALPVDYCKRWFEYYPAIPMANVYGPTECSDDITHFIFNKCSETWRAYVPIGKPVQNVNLYVLDKAQQPVPIGVTGELYVSGICLGRGYINNPGKTEKVFLTNPHAYKDDGSDSRMYRTGDFVRWLPGGILEFIGRKDEQVKIRGNRVEMGDIDAVLAGMPGVRRHVVMAITDANAGKRLAAYIVFDGIFDKAHAYAWLRQRLPEYMVPSWLVELESMPLTSNGKIDKKSLPLPFTEHRAVAGDEMPGNETEQILAGIWKEILRIDHVGMHDGFFELGGHSLLLMKMQLNIENHFFITIPLDILFQNDNIKTLAAYIQFRKSKKEHSIVDSPAFDL